MRQFTQAEEIERHGFHPVRLAGFDRDRPAAAGGVDENIDVAELFDCCSGKLFGGIFRVQIGFDHNRRAAAFGDDLFGQGIEQFAPACRHRHQHALFGKAARGSATDALAGAGDECGLPIEIEIHAASPD